MLNIKRVLTGDIPENCYLVYNDTTLLIIDPGADSKKIQTAIQEVKTAPTAILLTHTHYDHIGAVEELRHLYSIPVYVHPAEQEWLGNPAHNLSGLLRHDDIANIIVGKAEYELKEQNYKIGDISFEVRFTPGHSVGGVSFVFDDFIMTGDALFSGSIGRTDLYTGNMNQLLEAIQEKLFTLPDDMVIYPGHREESTIGKEKATNPFFKN